MHGMLCRINCTFIHNVQVPFRVTGIWIPDHCHCADSRSDFSLHPEEAERQDWEGCEGASVSPSVLLLAIGESPPLCQQAGLY